MSVLDQNLLDAATFGGPQSPLDIKPEAGTLLTTVTTMQSPGSASTSLVGFQPTSPSLPPSPDGWPERPANDWHLESTS